MGLVMLRKNGKVSDLKFRKRKRKKLLQGIYIQAITPEISCLDSNDSYISKNSLKFNTFVFCVVT